MKQEKNSRLTGWLIIKKLSIIAVSVMVLAFFIPLIKTFIKEEKPDASALLFAGLGGFLLLLFLRRSLHFKNLRVRIHKDHLEYQDTFRHETYRFDELRAWSYREGEEPGLIIHPKDYSRKLIVLGYEYPGFEEIETWVKSRYPNRDEIDRSEELKEVLKQTGFSGER
jgi:hypothetical protein